MYVDIDKLNDYAFEGLLSCNRNVDFPQLSIWNYTPKTQFENLWDDITLICRGLVTNLHGEVIALPFKKFFNIEENKHVPTKNFEVYEKLDGSLGILFNYNGEWILSTRGSFYSDQAIRGMKILKDTVNLDTFSKMYTYLFEIIFKENRIVVDYGDQEKLVLLGAIEKQSGKEIPYDLLCCLTKYPDIVKKYDYDDYSTLKNLNSPNKEGFVVKFDNGDRCKIKFEEYIKLHRVMTNTSTTSIWEAYRDEIDIYEKLQDIPDEYYYKVIEFYNSLNIEFNSIYNEHKLKFSSINSNNRKQFAERALSDKRYYSSILFNMYDNKDVKNIILNMIKPDFRKI